MVHHRFVNLLHPLFSLLILGCVIFLLGCSSETESGSSPSGEGDVSSLPQGAVITATGVISSDTQAIPPPEISAASPPNEPSTEPGGQTVAEAVDPAGQTPAPDVADLGSIEPGLASQNLITTTQSISNSASAPFTATMALESLSAYRLTFVTDFEGVRDGQPTSGRVSGLFEETKQPPARHWRLEVDSNAWADLTQLGPLEVYEIDDTVYVKNPKDGAWLAIPSAFAQAFLPNEVYHPQDSLDLPPTAVRLPGETVINGVLTRPFTFGLGDLADRSGYDGVQGAIWVAVAGNYIVKYEAVLSGRYDNSADDGLTLLDEGTVVVVYEVSGINSDLSLAAPEGATAIDLSRLFSAE